MSHSSFSKTLLPQWPTGASFDSTLAGIDKNVHTVIKVKLKSTQSVKLVIIAKPTTFPIFPGAESVLKDEIDENIVGLFQSLNISPYGAQ